MQLTLPGFPPPGRHDAAPVAAVPDPPDPLPGQLALFSDHTVLVRDIQVALGEADFEGAAGTLAMLRETYGPHGAARRYSFIDILAGIDWTSIPGALTAWESVDGAAAAEGHDVRAAVLRRLLRGHDPLAVFDARPALGGHLAAALARHRHLGTARQFVRDLLLAGNELEPLDFGWDGPVADLLAEHVGPVWLACRGGIRRLWPIPEIPGEPEITGPSVGARSFWHCMRVAVTPTCPLALRHEARRRMRKLDPELHRLWMQSGLG